MSAFCCKYQRWRQRKLQNNGGAITLLLFLRSCRRCVYDWHNSEQRQRRWWYQCLWKQRNPTRDRCESIMRNPKQRLWGLRDKDRDKPKAGKERGITRNQTTVSNVCLRQSSNCQFASLLSQPSSALLPFSLARSEALWWPKGPAASGTAMVPKWNQRSVEVWAVVLVRVRGLVLVNFWTDHLN